MTTSELSPTQILKYAERELGAFLRAISDSTEADLQQRAAEQWIDALMTTECNGAEPEAFFRRVSVVTAARIANAAPQSFVICGDLESSKCSLYTSM